MCWFLRVCRFVFFAVVLICCVLAVLLSVASFYFLRFCLRFGVLFGLFACVVIGLCLLVSVGFRLLGLLFVDFVLVLRCLVEV